MEVIGHLGGLFWGGFVVDLPERVEHNEVDQLREAHPLDTCVVTILDSESTDFKRMCLQVPVARTDVIMVAGEQDDWPVRRNFLELTHKPVVLHAVVIFQVVSDVAGDDHGCESVFIFKRESCFLLATEID